MPRKQHTYTIKEKRDALDLIAQVGVEKAAQVLDFPRGTVHSWWAQRDLLVAFGGSQASKTLKGQGRRELMPFVSALVTYMKDQRREEQVSHSSILLLPMILTYFNILAAHNRRYDRVHSAPPPRVAVGLPDAQEERGERAQSAGTDVSAYCQSVLTCDRYFSTF